MASGDSGNRLQRNPDTLRGADVAVLRAERFPAGRGVEGWVQGAPDVPVELVSDTQSVAELLRKAADYLAAGAQMVWVLDPDSRRVYVVTPSGAVQMLEADAELTGGAILPGFSCPVDRLVRSLPVGGTDLRPRAPHRPKEG